MNKSRLFKVIALVLTAVFMIAVFAGCATTATTTTTTTDGTASTGNSSVMMIVMLVVMVAIFYFLLIRPENKKKKQAEEMRNSISVGNEITTIGGIVGRVVAVSENYVVFETGEDRVRLQVTKWAISSKGKQTEEDQK